MRGTPTERVVWPWPVRSSARTTSPGPKRRVVPSPIPISICPARIKMYCRRGAVCQSLQYSAGQQRNTTLAPTTVEQHDILARPLDQEMVQTDLAEFVDDDRRCRHAGLLQDVVED